MQRLLRRKLKEELGVRLPLPGSRTRRISYTRKYIYIKNKDLYLGLELRFSPVDENMLQSADKRSRFELKSLRENSCFFTTKLSSGHFFADHCDAIDDAGIAGAWEMLNGISSFI